MKGESNNEIIIMKEIMKYGIMKEKYERILSTNLTKTFKKA